MGLKQLMPISLLISSILGFSIFSMFRIKSFEVIANYKVFKMSETPHTFFYIYEFIVSESDFITISRAYHNSLFGNPKVKFIVDTCMRDFLENNVIITKFLFIQYLDWCVRIKIDTNIGNEYTYIRIMSDHTHNSVNYFITPKKIQ